MPDITAISAFPDWFLLSCRRPLLGTPLILSSLQKPQATAPCQRWDSSSSRQGLEPVTWMVAPACQLAGIDFLSLQDQCNHCLRVFSCTVSLTVSEAPSE